MKKVTALLIACLLAFPVFSQNDTITADVPEILESEVSEVPAVPEPPEAPEAPEVSEDDMEFSTPDKTRVTIGENEIFIIEDNGDTTKLQLGNKGMSIVEGEDGYSIDIVEMDDDDQGKAEEKNEKKKKKFKPHYAGLDIGMNNFLNADNTLHTGTFMNLNTTKSWNFNFNFLEYGIGLGTSYAGLVTGMGFECSSYVFDNNNSIEEDANGDIVERISGLPNITKSKLAMTYLQAPLLLEFQIPAGEKRIHISGGVVGGLKLGSKTKIKYYDGGKQKEVIKDDYSLAPFRYGAMVRVGYRELNLFATYYFSPLFGETATPEIYPFSVGLQLTAF